jgi:hypothetical protein
VSRSERVPERRPERRARRSKYAVEKGLAGSLDSTAKGLAQLLASLQGSGFAEGLAGYRTLQAVLVQQKLWALTNRRTQVLPKFQPIASTAEKLHRIFAGYAAVMDTLRKLDELTEANAPPLADAPVAEPGSTSGEAKPASTSGEAKPAAAASPHEPSTAVRGR